MLVSRFDILFVKAALFPKVPKGFRPRKLRADELATATVNATFRSSMESLYPGKP